NHRVPFQLLRHLPELSLNKVLTDFLNYCVVSGSTQPGLTIPIPGSAVKHAVIDSDAQKTKDGLWAQIQDIEGGCAQSPRYNNDVRCNETS
ncbi:hypothetical protein L9F63_013776, partial [Diploptera punctata]